MSDEITLRDTERLRMTSDEQDDVEHAVCVLMGSSSARCRVAARSLMRLLGRHGVPGYASDEDLAAAAKAKAAADAMLRERLRNGALDAREKVTDHDAAPAAKAAEPARSPGRSQRGTGDTTREPVDVPATWQDECCEVEAAFARSNVRPTWPDDEPGNIGPMANAMADAIARLRITDAEREAVQICVERMQDSAVKSRRDAAATLRALLARLGGDA